MSTNTAQYPVSAEEMENLGIRLVDPVMDTCLHSHLPGVWLLHAAEPGESVKRAFNTHHEVAEGRWQIEMDRVWLCTKGGTSPKELLERRLEKDRAFHAGRRSGEGVPLRVRHYGFPYEHGVELANVLVEEDKEHLPPAAPRAPRSEPFAPPVSAEEMEAAGIVVVGRHDGERWGVGYRLFGTEAGELVPCLWAEKSPRERIEDDCRVVPRLPFSHRRIWGCLQWTDRLHVVPDRVWLRGTPDPLLYLEYWMRYYERMGEDRDGLGWPGRRPRHYGFPCEHGVELATVWVSDNPEAPEGWLAEEVPDPAGLRAESHSV